jgi:hypothetical protein
MLGAVPAAQRDPTPAQLSDAIAAALVHNRRALGRRYSRARAPTSTSDAEYPALAGSSIFDLTDIDDIRRDIRHRIFSADRRMSCARSMLRRNRPAHAAPRQLDDPNRGRVEFRAVRPDGGEDGGGGGGGATTTGCYTEGRGNWLIKPNRFERVNSRRHHRLSALRCLHTSLRCPSLPAQISEHRRSSEGRQ